MESKYEVLKFEPETVDFIRKELNLDTNQKREEAFRVIEDWLQKQDHLLKKDFSREYIERCLVTCNGLLEKTKLQIDKICTMRTLLPKYFQVTNLKDKEFVHILSDGYVGYSQRLTKDHYRLVTVKLAMDAKLFDFTAICKCSAILGEFIKNYDYCRGYIVVFDFLEPKSLELLSKINLLEVQQFIPVILAGYGLKVKNIIFLTSSSIIEGFIKIIKPLFSAKIASRMNVAKNKEHLKQFVPDYVLPEEYGGTEKPLKKLFDELVGTVCKPTVQSMLKEMIAAKTDESKRQKDKFNEQYMGMPGSFRTISLD